MPEAVKAAEIDWTIVGVAAGTGLVLLIAGIVISIFVVRWVFRVNQTANALKTVVKRLEGIEKALGGMPEKPSGARQDISAVQADLRKIGAVLSDIRELLERTEKRAAAGASSRPADASGWQRAIRMGETASVDEPPPLYEEDLAAQIGIPSEAVDGTGDAGEDDVPPLDDIGAERKERAEAGKDTGGRPKTVRARAVVPPSAPPDRGSVISLEELSASLQEEEGDAAPGKKDEGFEIVGQKVTEGLQGRTLMGYVLIKDRAVPEGEDEFSKLSDRASRGFFGMYPNAAAVQVDFYREWEGKYLLMGTYEWRKHTSTGAGIRKTWHLYGVPESWITYEKEDAPWGLRRE